MRYAILCATILVTITSNAQWPGSDTVEPKSIFLRFNPLHLVDPRDPAISFGGEYRFHYNWSAALDAGFIFFSHHYQRQATTTGLLLRPAIRFFPNGERFYLEAELHYKLANYRMQDWVGRGVVNNVPAYDEYREFSLRKRVAGAHFKAGRMFRLSDKMWMEVYLGVGLHYRKYYIARNRDMLYVINDIFGDPTTTNTTEKLYAFPAGVRVMYKLK